MKLLAFSDLHLSLSALDSIKEKISESKPDYLVCAGDITIFEDNMEWILQRFASLNIPMLAIHGNHEGESTMKKAVERHDHFVWMHKKAIDVDGILFLGFGGGGFAQVEPEFERWTASIEPKVESARKVVLVTHAPPYKTKLDELYAGEHVGVKSFYQWIHRHSRKVTLAISGHIHETAGRMDSIGTARILNPGAKGRIVIV